jgi:hypothetical protein
MPCHVTHLYDTHLSGRNYLPRTEPSAAWCHRCLFRIGKSTDRWGGGGGDSRVGGGAGHDIGTKNPFFTCTICIKITVVILTPARCILYLLVAPLTQSLLTYIKTMTHAKTISYMKVTKTAPQCLNSILQDFASLNMEPRRTERLQ